MEIIGPIQTPESDAVVGRDEERLADAMALVQSMLRPGDARMQEIYQDWIEKESWTIIEAATIGIGVDPNLLEAIQFMVPEDACRFHKLRDLLDRKYPSGLVKPADFAKWVQENKTIKRMIDGNLVAEIQRRMKTEPRPCDESKKQVTLEKMVITMALKYGFSGGIKSVNAVADSIKKDFDKFSTGMTLSRGAVIAALSNALEEHDHLREAIERRIASKAGTAASK